MKNGVYCLICMAVGIALGLLLSLRNKPRVEIRTETVTDTVYTEVHDTVPSEKLVKEKVLKYVYVGGDTIFSNDTLIVRDSIPIPITQKEYKDSLYHAWVSGYLPSLDSIYVRQREVTNTVTITKTIRRKWGIGVQGGYGYGIISKQFEPYIGVGVHYNIK